MNHNFRKLKIWQQAMEMVMMIYKLTEDYPDSEKYGLTVQSRKAAVSVASNIAEGAGRQTNKDFSNFIDISMGSSNELITQLIIAQKLSYLSELESQKMIDEIISWQNMAYKFQKNNLKNKINEPVS